MNRGIGVILLIAFVAVCLFVPFLGLSEYHIHVLTMMLINALIAGGLRMIMTTGLVSFSHAAFVAIGGYASALTAMELGWSSWIGLVLAIVITMCLAIPFGFILLRLRGVYFFMATIALAEFILVVFTRWQYPFGGAAGLRHIPFPNPISFFGFFALTFGTKLSFYYFAFVLASVLLGIAYLLERGRLGDIWTGIQQAEQAAQSLGVNVMLYKMMAFTIGSVMAAVAGVVQTHYQTQINPQAYGLMAMMDYLIFVVVGGSKRFVGPLIGVVFLTVISEWLGSYEALISFKPIIYSFLLIMVVMFWPGGLASLVDQLLPKVTSLKRSERRSLNLSPISGDHPEISK
jgi:branched-chain amino acid transport system permease protein